MIFDIPKYIPQNVPNISRSKPIFFHCTPLISIIAALVNISNSVLVRPCLNISTPNVITTMALHITPAFLTPFTIWFFDIISAISNITPSLAISAGCSENPSSVMLRRAPLITSPNIWT